MALSPNTTRTTLMDTIPPHAAHWSLLTSGLAYLLGHLPQVNQVLQTIACMVSIVSGCAAAVYYITSIGKKR